MLRLLQGCRMPRDDRTKHEHEGTHDGIEPYIVIRSRSKREASGHHINKHKVDEADCRCFLLGGGCVPELKPYSMYSASPLREGAVLAPLARFDNITTNDGAD